MLRMGKKREARQKVNAKNLGFEKSNGKKWKTLRITNFIHEKNEKTPSFLYILCENIVPTYLSVGMNLPIAARYTLNTAQNEQSPCELINFFPLKKGDSQHLCFLKPRLMSGLGESRGGIQVYHHDAFYAFEQAYLIFDGDGSFSRSL